MHSLVLSVFIMGALSFLAPLKSKADCFHSEGDTIIKKTGTPEDHKSTTKHSNSRMQKQLYRRLPPDQLKKASEGALLPPNHSRTLNNNYIAFQRSKK
jgi:hypothetical protein